MLVRRCDSECIGIHVVDLAEALPVTGENGFPLTEKKELSARGCVPHSPRPPVRDQGRTHADGTCANADEDREQRVSES